MKFDCHNGDRGCVFDADGVQIPHAIRGDTETGEVQYFLPDESNPKLIRRAANGEPLSGIRHFKAPLRVEPL